MKRTQNIPRTQSREEEQMQLRQAGKTWLGVYLDYITPIRFSVGGTDKEATECGGSRSDQLTVFSS